MRTKPGGTSLVTDGEVPSKSLHLQGSETFVENVFPFSEFSFILGVFLGLACEKFRHVGNVANPENMILCIIFQIPLFRRKTYS